MIQPDQEPIAEQAAARFDRMAARIRNNAPEDFCGGAVIVPPNGGQIELLLLDSSVDPAIFWATVQTRVQSEIDKLKDQPQQGWTTRR